MREPLPEGWEVTDTDADGGEWNTGSWYSSEIGWEWTHLNGPFPEGTRNPTLSIDVPDDASGTYRLHADMTYTDYSTGESRRVHEDITLTVAVRNPSPEATPEPTAESTPTPELTSEVTTETVSPSESTLTRESTSEGADTGTETVAEFESGPAETSESPAMRDGVPWMEVFGTAFIAIALLSATLLVVNTGRDSRR